MSGSGHAPTGISVVIPVLNGAATIGAQLEAVIAQATDPYEVIVVDNGSTDATVELVERLRGTYPQVILVDGSSLPRGGAAAKNAGVRAARFPLVAFCDADDLVREGWLEVLRHALEHAEVVTCDREYRSLNPHLARRYPPQRARRCSYTILGLEGISGGAFGIRRDRYLSLGGFDEEMGGAVDSDFAVRVARAGVVPVHECAAVVSVRLTTDPRTSFRRATALATSTHVIAARYGIQHNVTNKGLARIGVGLLRPIRAWRVDERLDWASRAGTFVGHLRAIRGTARQALG